MENCRNANDYLRIQKRIEKRKLPQAFDYFYRYCHWIIILNSNTDLYGSYDYDSQEDVARFVCIPTVANRFYETLNFDVEILPNDARVFLSWANTQVSFAVETSTDQEIHERIQQELLTRQDKDADRYAGAAEYLFFQGANLADALVLTDIAIELDADNGWARTLKIKVCERMKLYDQALEAIAEYRAYVLARDWENEEGKEPFSLKGYYVIDDVAVEELRDYSALDRETTLPVGSIIPLNNINFLSGTTELSDQQSYTVLRELTSYLQAHPATKIRINGHTDAVGSERANLSLSKRRARVIAQQLIAGGVQKDRISWKGFGEDSPIASNETTAGRSQNRRVEFEVVE